jgi:hypothetical protein
MEQYQSKTLKSNKLQSIEDMQRCAHARCVRTNTQTPRNVSTLTHTHKQTHAHKHKHTDTRKHARTHPHARSLDLISGRFMDAYPEFKQLGGRCTAEYRIEYSEYPSGVT